ncbi:hypothetical protein HKCCE4037_13390 [Rhodobacterales bacterium HKCCE4037]|nr:hypothetical protein [Rhodobacterales bacterium HKCCE4037]
MMTKHRRQEGFWSSLRARLAVLLSIAILPLGVVAVLQTADVVAKAQRLERSDLLERTQRAVNAERALLRHALGAAEALGISAATVGSESPACSQLMEDYVARNASIVFAGYSDADGILRCASNGRVVDINGRPTWENVSGNPRPLITYSAVGAASGQEVLVATMPVLDPENGSLRGAAFVSLPGALFDTLLGPGLDGVELALLDHDGTVLATSAENAERIEALGIIPSELEIINGGYTRDLEDTATAELAVLVPLISDRVYVLGIWEGMRGNFSVSPFGLSAPLFPLVMWAVAMGVAILAVDRLVLRHLRSVRSHMARFSFDDPGDSFATLDDPPREIADIADTYNRMVDRILGDRTVLAEALQEKELLLREVHHRVKNNLQLIASILNIQIRSAPPASRHILRRMQDRVMGLSSIHKALYSGNTLSEVRVDRLLDELLQSTISIGLPAGSTVKIEFDLDPISLDPDQAVPLTLLALELATNAVKYVGRRPDGDAYIRVSLDLQGKDVLLSIENTLGLPIQDQEVTEGTGLGHQLIEAFVSQLGGKMETEASDALHSVRVHCADLLVGEIEEAEPAGEEEPDEQRGVGNRRAS